MHVSCSSTEINDTLYALTCLMSLAVIKTDNKMRLLLGWAIETAPEVGVTTGAGVAAGATVEATGASVLVATSCSTFAASKLRLQG
jgi:hypothetical protein